MTIKPETFDLLPLPEDINTRIDKFICKYITSLSRTQIQNLIKNNFVYEDQVVISSISSKVKNKSYHVTVPTPKANHIEGREIPLNIVYEDDDIILLNKQRGLTTHPGAGNYNNTLVNALINYLGDKLSSIGGTERPGIVHRLDKDTSGLLIVAKNDFSHQHLSNQLQTRELKRVYHAICWGTPKPILGTIETYIRRHKTNRLKMDVNKYDGKLAITHYKLIKSYNDKVSLIECSLATGRTHQIRVHMANVGYSIIGDKLYGSSHQTKYVSLPEKAGNLCHKFPGQALIAKKIGFIHPRSEEYLEFEIEYESYMKELIEALVEL